MSFSHDIRLLRQQTLMSQSSFAKAIGVSYTSVKRWECGKSKPSYKAMQLIDEYCSKNCLDFNIKKYLTDNGTKESNEK